MSVVEEPFNWALAEVPIAGNRGRTDVANGERLAQSRGRDLHWIEKWGAFIAWDGRRWATDGSQTMVDAWGREVYLSLYDEATAAAQAGAEAKLMATIHSFIRASGSDKGIRAMISRVKSEPDIAIDHRALDTQGWLFNCENGTVDLKTGVLRPHRREDMITKLAPVVFDAAAQCPAWEKFIAEIFANDQDLISYVQRCVGYSLTGDTSAQAMFVLHGEGANGKSTLINAMLELMGEGYATKAPRNFLMVKKHDDHPTELADLFGLRFVAAVETEDGQHLAESFVKELTGSDHIKARRLYENFWKFVPSHKIWLATNYRPEIKGSDHAIWRRLKLIPFTQRFEGASRDDDLPNKLRAEYSGVLNWCLAGLRDYLEVGLHEPEIITKATQSYKAENDLVGRFLAEYTTPKEGGRCKAMELYTKFRAACEIQGEVPLAQKPFSQGVQRLGFKRDKKGIYVYEGLILK